MNKKITPLTGTYYLLGRDNHYSKREDQPWPLTEEMVGAMEKRGFQLHNSVEENRTAYFVGSC